MPAAVGVSMNLQVFLFTFYAFIHIMVTFAKTMTRK